MALAEIPFESITGAIEVARGTGIAAPTYFLNMTGTLTPTVEMFYPADNLQTLEDYSRSAPMQHGAQLEAEGALDPNTAHIIAAMAVKGSAVITTPGGGTLSRLWTYTPTQTADDLKSSTFWWGDPGLGKVFCGAYGMIDEWNISSGDAGKDGSTNSISGFTKFPTTPTPPTYPAKASGPLIVASNLQLWIDTASAFGTTAITGRVISAEHNIVTNIAKKYVAQGTGAALDFDHVGRNKRHIETKVVFELADTTQYDQWAASSLVKVRVRHNGPLIEGTLYHYVEVDTYGRWSGFVWGDLEGTNRTVELTVISEYESGLGASWSLKVQNTKTALP